LDRAISVRHDGGRPIRLAGQRCPGGRRTRQVYPRRLRVAPLIRRFSVWNYLLRLWRQMDATNPAGGCHVATRRISNR